jgi:hypothetical protein
MKLGFWKGWGKPFSIGTMKSGAGDTTRPTVAITANAATITAAAFTATFTLSEVSTDFLIGSITVGNGSASNFAGSGTSYTCTITPTALGNVTVDVAAGAFHDAAGNENTAATQFSILYINPVMWVKADAGAGTNDGDVVTTWTDQSGNANSPTQATANAKPTYQTNEVNGKPVVRGDGGDSLKVAFTLNQPCSYLFVFKMVAEGDSKTVFDGNAVNAGRFTETVAASDTFRIFAGAGLNIVHPAVAGFAIGTATFNGASSRVSIGATVATGNSGAANPGGITLFANGNGLEAGNLDIAEMIMFSGALSDANYNLIGSYLGTKYALTWTNF